MKNIIRILFLIFLLFTSYMLFARVTSPNEVLDIKNWSNGQNSSADETTASETQILRLEFRVSSGASRSFVLGFTEDATDGYDYGYDTVNLKPSGR